MGTSLFSLGTRAMFANQAALQTIGHNIANASVAGYSRQQVEFATAGGQFGGAGYFGRGVDVATVTRAHDAFLTREAAFAQSLASMDAARAEQLSRLEAVFDTGESGIGHAAGQFLNALGDVAARPSDLAARQVVLARAEDFAARLRQAGGELDALQAGVTQDLGNAVAQVNSLAARIAKVNAEIVSVRGTGHSPNDLLDQRDRLVQELSGLVQVTTVQADDGSLGVFVAGGQRLVLGANAEKLALVPHAFDPQRVALAISESGLQRELPASLLAGGSIAGQLRFQDDDLVDARNRIGQIAAAVSSAVNGQQALGVDLLSSAGSPIFAAGAPRVLPAQTNARGPGGAFLASPTLAVTDARQLQASDYELRADPSGTPGAWQLTRLSDGLVRTVADGDVVDGFRLTLGAPAPAATDRFVLQPVARAANEMRRVLDDPRGLAAASPVTATLGVGNTGTASIASLAAVSTALDPSRRASITFTNDSGAYAWELRDAGGALVGSGTGTWSPTSPIALNGFELRLGGVPKSGDTVTVSRTPFPAANNGNAQAMLALRDAALVGGANVTDAWAGAIADVGVRVQGAQGSADISAAVAADARARRESQAGVNLDEEAARLIQFQQGYQAAAKILQVAQSVFDTLLDATRG